MTATMTITAGNSLKTTPNASVPMTNAEIRERAMPGSAIDVASALEVGTAVQVDSTMAVNFNSTGPTPVAELEVNKDVPTYH